MKCNLFILTLILVIAHTKGHASDSLRSAVSLQQQTEESIKLVGKPLQINCGSAEKKTVDSQIYTPKHNLPKDGADNDIAISGISMEYAKQLFKELTESKEIQFKFTNNGCEARAHKMVKLLEQKGIIAAKVFIQGAENDEHALRFQTPLVSKGHVDWNFHVAPILKVKTGKKVKIKVKDGWFKSKEIEVDEYIDMVFDPSTNSKPTPLNKWRSNLTKHRKDKSITTFFTKRFNYRPYERYNTPNSYNENDDFQMMSGLDFGIECYKNKQLGIVDRRCEFK